MEIISTTIGPYLVKAYCFGYILYLDFNTIDDITRIVRIPLGPELLKEIDSHLMNTEHWGIPFSVQTPIINPAMDKYTLSIGFINDAPSERDDYVLEVYSYNAVFNKTEVVFSVPIDENDIVHLRGLLYNTAHGGCINAS